MLDMVIDARAADLGNGLQVRRILPYRKRRMVGPFIFLDHAGPVTLPPDAPVDHDVRPHPHIGLSTVSYLFGGTITHRDSTGAHQVIRPGEVNWMTAGSGIAHSERFEDPAVLARGDFELAQTWVALPEDAEEVAPSFTHYAADHLQVVQEKGVWMRLIAGSAYGLASVVRTHSPLFYLHVQLAAGARLGPPRGHAERGAYVARGEVEMDGRRYGVGQLLVFSAEDDPQIQAIQPSTIMLLGGEPLGERFIWWNFVSSRKERIEQAKADWLAGRIALPPGDDHEFEPLPQDRRPAPQPLS